MVRAYPRYFADIRASTVRLATDDEVQGRIRDGYRKIGDMYAPAVFPPATFLIGRFSTGGTTSSNGMLVGLEFYAITASTPLDELAKFRRENVHSLDSLPVIVAHEHTPVLQERAGGIATHRNKTLLDQSLLEQPRERNYGPPRRPRLLHRVSDRGDVLRARDGQARRAQGDHRGGRFGHVPGAERVRSVGESLSSRQRGWL